MTPLLEQLRITEPPPQEAADLVMVHNTVLNAVEHKLTHPSDEILDQIAAAEYALRIPSAPMGYKRQPAWYKEQRRDEARRWLAAVAAVYAGHDT